MISPSSLTLSRVSPFTPPLLTQKVFIEHSRHSYVIGGRATRAEGCNFHEGPRWTEARAPSRGTRRTPFPPVSSRAHRPPEKGTLKPGNQRTTVRSTVNACSVPSLTTILAPCRSLARSCARAPPVTASNERCRLGPFLEPDLATGGWSQRVLLFEDTPSETNFLEKLRPS